MAKSIRNRLICSGSVLCMSVLLLSGCQTIQNIQKLNQTDVCYSIAQPLYKAQSTVADTRMQAAIAGAVVGGIVGTMAGKDAQSAVIGAAAGGILGGVAGDQYGRVLSDRERSQLLREINTAAADKSRSLNTAPGAIRRLTQCRERQVAQIRKKLDLGTLSKEEARTQLMTVQEQIAADNTVISNIISGSDTWTQEYIRVGIDHGIPEQTLVWQSSQSTSVQPDEEPYIVKTRSRIRSGPGTNYEVRGLLAKGETLHVTDETPDGKWKQFSFNGQTAYVLADLVEKSSTGSKEKIVEIAERPQNNVQAMSQSTDEIRSESQKHEELGNEVYEFMIELVE